MKYTTLSNTNIKVSKICMGTMTFGKQNTQEEAFEQLDYATDFGINFIDTAEMYPVPADAERNGDTERILGNWFTERKNRDKFILASKVCGPNRALPYIREDLNFTPSQLRIALEGSLKRLKTDYIDVYQLHWPERNTNMFNVRGYNHKEDEKWQYNFKEVIETLNSFIKEGKIRHWGTSNETPWGMMKFLDESRKNEFSLPVSIQNPYSLLNRTYEIGLAEISMRENIGLLAYSPLAFGMLSGKYIDGTATPNSRMNQFKNFTRYLSPACTDATKAYMEVAKEHNVSLTQAALAWVNTRTFVTSNIVSATTMDQLKEDLDSINFELTDELLKDLDKVYKRYPDPAP